MGKRKKLRKCTREVDAIDWQIESNTFCLRVDGKLIEEQATCVTKQHVAEVKEIVDKARQLVHAMCEKVGLQRWRAHTALMHPLGKAPKLLRNSFDVNSESTSQAYCKFLEIINSFPQLIPYGITQIKSFHLCEGPGHFILALDRYLCAFHPQLHWLYQSNTLNPWEETISSTDKLIDDSVTSVHPANWHFGADDTGDILKWDSEYVAQIRNKFGGFDLVTADGSNYMQNSPAEQEELILPLLQAELRIGMGLLSNGGSMIIKIYSMFIESTLSLLAEVIGRFREAHVIKPLCSKAGNGERYLVLLNFNGDASYNQQEIDISKKALMFCEMKFSTQQCAAITRNLATFQRYFSRGSLTKWRDLLVNEYMRRVKVEQLALLRRARWVPVSLEPNRWVCMFGFNYCERIRLIGTREAAVQCLRTFYMNTQQSMLDLSANSGNVQRHCATSGWPADFVAFFDQSINNLTHEKVIVPASSSFSAVRHSLFTDPLLLYSMNLIDSNKALDWFTRLNETNTYAIIVYSRLEGSKVETHDLHSLLDCLQLIRHICLQRQCISSVSLGWRSSNRPLAISRLSASVLSLFSMLFSNHPITHDHNCITFEGQFEVHIALSAKIAMFLERMIRQFPDGKIASFVPLSPTLNYAPFHAFIVNFNEIQWTCIIENFLSSFVCNDS